jgi:hypothetical protein
VRALVQAGLVSLALDDQPRAEVLIEQFAPVQGATLPAQLNRLRAIDARDFF